MQNAQDKEAVDKVMGDLDSNNDGEVDFTEFIILVGALTVACNDFFLEYNEKQEKKKWTPRRHEHNRVCTPMSSREEAALTGEDIHTYTNTHTSEESLLGVCVFVCMGLINSL